MRVLVRAANALVTIPVWSGVARTTPAVSDSGRVLIALAMQTRGHCRDVCAVLATPNDGTCPHPKVVGQVVVETCDSSDSFVEIAYIICCPTLTRRRAHDHLKACSGRRFDAIVLDLVSVRGEIGRPIPPTHCSVPVHAHGKRKRF